MLTKSMKTMLMFLILSFPLLGQNKNISIHRLDNGLEVLLIENPALPMVGVNVAVKVGSAYESFSTSGMSHMLEHLLFNGTTSRTQKQLYDDVDRIGGYNNANTGDFYTNFMMVTPAENIRLGMEIQADMLFHSTLPEDKFQKEKGIVLEEISKTFADPNAQLERNLNSILFKGHALSLPTLGTYATIKGLDRDQVFEFYKNFYVPNNMRLSVIGNFDAQKMLEMINEIYGQEEPGLVIVPELSNWSFAFDRSHLQLPQPGKIFHRFYDGQHPVVQIIFPITQNFDHIAFRLLDDKLSEMALDFQQQLGKLAKRVEMQTITSPVANYLEVKITTTSKKPDFAALRQQTVAFLQKADFSSSEAEMMASANQIKTFFLKNIEKPHMFGIYNAYLIATIGFDEMLDSFEKEHVLHAARQLNAFKVTEQPFMVLQLPRQKSNRQQQLQTEVKLFEGQAGRPTLIVKRNPASQLVAIHFLIKHKAYWQSKFGKNAAQILHDCFGQRLKSEENQAMTQKFGLSVTVNDNPYIPMDDIYLHPDFGYIRIEGLNTDLNGLIDFLSRQMKDFVPNQAEFQKARAKLGAMSGMGMMGDPAKKLFDRLYKEQVYEPSSYPEGAEELTYEALLNFTKNYFQPANMIVSVVSSAKPEAVRHAFAGFAGAPVDQEPEVYSQKIKLHNQPVKIEQAGHGKRAYLFWGFAKAIEPGDAVALKALSLLLGDKIVFQIREKQGMAYHMRAGIKVQPDRALFYISQGTRPENVETLLKQYPTFFTLQVVNEFKKADLEKSVNMYLGRMMFRRLSSINQAYYLGHSYYFYQDIHYDQKFLDALKKVTLEDVRRVAGKYLQVENPVEIVVK